MADTFPAKTPALAAQIVRELVDQGCDKLEVSPAMYEALSEETSPKTPSEYFGIPITVLSGEPTKH